MFYKKGSIVYNLKNLWDLLSKKERNKALIFTILILCQVLLETLSIGALYPFFLNLFGSQVETNQETWFNFELIKNLIKGQSVFINLSLVIFLIFLLKNLFLIFVVHWTQTFEREIKLRLKKKLLNVYLLKDYIFHVSRATGKLVRNINTATDTIMMATRVAMIFLTDMMMLLGLLILMSIINFKFVISGLIVVVFFSIIYFYFFKKILIKFGEFTFEYQGEALKKLLQTFSMIKEIKIFRKENYFIQSFYNEEKKFQFFQRKAYIIRSYLKPFFEILFIASLLVFFNYNSTENGSIENTLPQLAIFSIILLRLIPSLSKIINSLQKQNQYQAAIDSVKDDLYINLDDLKNIDYNLVEFKDFKSLELKDISFKYPDKKKFILENFSLKINKGEYIGIMGQSGSGKSTLIDIIVGLLNTEKGQINFNNQKIDTKNPEWKNLFSYVPQTVNLFNDSLLTNITFENDEKNVDQEKLNQSIKNSGLNNFIEKYNNDFKINLGEIGGKISGGERQRVSIARALYKNTEIIIFDEAFNSLDSDTKSDILSEVRILSDVKTIISISHSKEDLKDCHKIIDLNQYK
jgi:ATP-binding cassette, subfamily B, bacterial PglK